MQNHTNRPSLASTLHHRADERGLLLEEVNFKWLLAGLGVWIDMSRFRSDPSYSSRFLELAEASDSHALRACAASLQRKAMLLVREFRSH